MSLFLRSVAKQHSDFIRFSTSTRPAKLSVRRKYFVVNYMWLPSDYLRVRTKKVQIVLGSAISCDLHSLFRNSLTGSVSHRLKLLY